MSVKETTLIIPNSKQSYTEQQKLQIVEEYLNSGLTMSKFARKMGLDKSQISRWSNQVSAPTRATTVAKSLQPFDPFSIQDKELLTMNTVFNSMKDLDQESAMRIMDWIGIRVLGKKIVYN